MQVQQRWLSSSLSKAVCHSHGRRLLQTEYIFEVRREVLEKRLLCRSGVPKNGRQSETSQEIERRILNAYPVGRDILNGRLNFGFGVFAHLHSLCNICCSAHWIVTMCIPDHMQIFAAFSEPENVMK